MVQSRWRIEHHQKERCSIIEINNLKNGGPQSSIFFVEKLIMKLLNLAYLLVLLCIATEASAKGSIIHSDSMKYKLLLKKSIPNPATVEMDYFIAKYGLTGKNRYLGLSYRYNWNKPTYKDRVKDSALEDVNIASVYNFDSIEIQLYKKDSFNDGEMFISKHLLVLKKEHQEIKIIDLYQLCKTYKEELQDLRIEDSLLYFNLACPSYSKEMGGNCSKLYCLNVNTGELLWKSNSLSSNGGFILYEDLIVSGYGFTDELDYVYLIDKNSGRRLASYKLNKMTVYFEFKDDELYVIDYNKRLYVFEIQAIKI
jgi:hypothetical protein